VLRAGAVLGSTFDPQLAAATAGIDLPAALQACERALSDGLLKVAGRQYEFAHDLVREVLYSTTPPPTRTALHERAMDAAALTPEQVAGHAAAVGDWLRAARSWLSAGEQALRNFAAADAAALAGRALAAAQRATDLEQRGRALVLRGRALYAQGRNEDAWEDLNAAVAVAREAGDRRLEMMALREVAGDVPVALGHPPASLSTPLLRCLNLAEELGAREIEADLLCRLVVLGITRLDFAAADRHSRQALALAEGSTDGRVRELALDARKSAVAYLGEVTELAKIVDELEALNRRSGDLYRLQWTLVESALVPLIAGDYAASVARIEAALAACRRSGYTAIEPYYVAQLAWVHRLAGDTAAAIDVGTEAVSLARRHSHAWWLATAAAVHGTTLLEVGRSDEAATLLTAVLPGIDVPGGDAYLVRCLGPLAAATGDAETVAHAERLLLGIKAPPGAAWLAGADTYLATARALTDAGHPDRAAQLLEPLVAAARTVGWGDLLRRAEPATA
jgi:tetratricopeptide (TPR) repeat protein